MANFNFITSSAILGTFVLLCILSYFVQNDFLSAFSLVDNYKALYGHNPSQADPNSRVLHGFKFLLIIVSISLHSIVCMGILFAQPYAPVKEIEFDDFLKTILNKVYIVADNMVRKKSLDDLEDSK